MSKRMGELREFAESLAFGLICGVAAFVALWLPWKLACWVYP